MFRINFRHIGLKLLQHYTVYRLLGVGSPTKRGQTLKFLKATRRSEVLGRFFYLNIFLDNVGGLQHKIPQDALTYPKRHKNKNLLNGSGEF